MRRWKRLLSPSVVRCENTMTALTLVLLSELAGLLMALRKPFASVRLVVRSSRAWRKARTPSISLTAGGSGMAWQDDAPGAPA
jgi:hypothetical protein